jgi:outer membrane protein assembly factor BamB
MRTLCINLLIIFILTSCGPTEEPILPPEITVEEPAPFEMLWATRMDFEKEIVGTDNTLAYGDHMLVGGDIGDPATIMAFDKMTGEKEWEFVYEALENDHISYALLVDHNYVAVTGRAIFVYDLDTRAVLWTYGFIDEGGYQRSKGPVHHDGRIYIEVITGLHATDRLSELMSFDLLTGDRRIDYHAPTDSLGGKDLSPPVFYVDTDTGKELMIISEKPNALAIPEEGRQDMIAIDTGTGEVVWRTRNITNTQSSNGSHPPVIYEDIVIIGAAWNMHGLDAKTGEMLWTYAFDYPWSIWNKTNHLVYGDRLYVNNGQFDVTCLDAATGRLIWNNPEGGPNCTDNMVYYEKEDLLVFTSWGYGSIMILDAISGETIHRERKYDNSQYNTDVVYDSERDMFFTSSYKHAIAFKVSRP